MLKWQLAGGGRTRQRTEGRASMPMNGRANAIPAEPRPGWMDLPARIGDRVGRLIGAQPGTVVMGDTLSIKVYQALASALELRPDRRVILSDTGNFPSDLYMAEGLCRTLGPDYALKTVAPEAIETAIDDHVAVLMITEAITAPGRNHDMATPDRQKLLLLFRFFPGHFAHYAVCDPVLSSGCEMPILPGFQLTNTSIPPP